MGVRLSVFWYPANGDIPDINGGQTLLIRGVFVGWDGSRIARTRPRRCWYASPPAPAGRRVRWTRCAVAPTCRPTDPGGSDTLSGMGFAGTDAVGREACERPLFWGLRTSGPCDRLPAAVRASATWTLAGRRPGRGERAGGPRGPAHDPGRPSARPARHPLSGTVRELGHSRAAGAAAVTEPEILSPASARSWRGCRPSCETASSSAVARRWPHATCATASRMIWTSSRSRARNRRFLAAPARVVELFRVVSGQRLGDRCQFVLDEGGAPLKLEAVPLYFDRLAAPQRWQGVWVESLEDLAANKLLALVDRFDRRISSTCTF